MRNGMLYAVGCTAVVALVGCSGTSDGGIGQVSSALHDHGGDSLTSLPNNFPFANGSGFAATYSTNGSVDLTNEFFQNLGTNGRACVSCHQPQNNWTVTPANVQERFELSGGTDPIFRTNDGSVSPNADVSTVEARRAAYSMLLSKALIRIGIGMPAGAEFTLDAVDDPYGFASAAKLSLFRRPLPSTNLDISTVMWDGRETFKDLGSTDCTRPPFAPICFASLHFDLADQANGATTGHAQGNSLTVAQESSIVAFETAMFSAQIWDSQAHNLEARGALGGPVNLAAQDFYFGINDNTGDYKTGAPFTPEIFTTYKSWEDASEDRGHGVEAARDQIARGEKLFNSKPITISGVAGLNDVFGAPVLVGTCGTCHDSPNVGDHSIPAPLNIGLADASRRTPDMPLYTFRNIKTGATVQSTDPGRGLITGKWADIGKFKGPVLRGLAARAPYFHNGSAADLGTAIDFYDTRFNVGFTSDERADLVAFLGAL